MAVYNGKDYEPIENYGIIGNLSTAALISLKGSLDFMCYPRFDSPSVFCKLLDAQKGGSFQIIPAMQNPISKQLYLPDTNILLTRFFSDEGIAEVIDYMPVNDHELNGCLVRKITTVRGHINYKVICSPAFNYARTDHQVKRLDNSLVTFVPSDNSIVPMALSSDQQIGIDGSSAVSEFCLEEHNSAVFLFEPNENLERREDHLHELVENSYRATIDYWHKWIDKCNYDGRWQEIVHRSALTLKLLISQEYGSMIAAPTFSLPEGIGTQRTWDYRYTWIRDAAFSMHAFLQLGFVDEAKRFLDWVRVQSAEKELQLMFAIDGSTDLNEKILHHLEGYKQSTPVRIGNAAFSQTQMDIFGELMETVYLYVSHGGDLTFEYWKIIQEYVQFVIQNWRQPDHSIWEVRGPAREFLFSRMMCWIALDRAIKIGNHFSYPFDYEKWYSERDRVYYDIYENFWNEKVGAYVQYKGSEHVDASALLMPILGIISPSAERWAKTMKAIDENLRSDVLVKRYSEDVLDIDGLKGEEGTFSICSFWHVECLSLMDRIEEAKEHFEKMMGYANHLGLFAEQIGMKGEHLGNFPQAFTHLALISAAVEIRNMENTKKFKHPSY